MTQTSIKFFAVLFTALALVPAGAHLMALPNKLHLSAEAYLRVQQIYRGWSLSGLLVFGALLSTSALAFRLRRQPGFTAAAVGAACIVATQIVFWSLTYPANAATQQWTMLPTQWQQLRLRWEYSHALSAVLNLGALTATALAALRSGQHHV